MRLVLTALLVLAGSSAFASSITSIGGVAAQAPSISETRCSDCPPPKPREDRSTYHVPSLPAGTQKTVIVEVGGEKKLARTEAWLGGSPVVYVSKLQDWDRDAAAPQMASPADSVDFAATTGALSGAPTAHRPDDVTALASSDFELRLQPAH